MQRILVRPDDLKAFSTELKHVSVQLARAAQRLRSSVSSMDWDTGQREVVEREIMTASRQAALLAERADRMAAFLSERAELFREADARGAGEVHLVLDGLRNWMGEVANWAASRNLDAGDVGYLGLMLGGTVALPGLVVGDWLRDRMPADSMPVEPQPRIFQGVDLHRYFSAAQAKALNYTLTKEGGGFATAHGSVRAELQPGVYSWDGTLLNYGIISFAFPQGGGYGLLNRLVNDSGAAAALDQLFPQYVGSDELKEGFVEAFSSGQGAAVAWWKEHAMADEHHVKPEWTAMLRAWAETEENKRIQLEQVASSYMTPAVGWAQEYGIQSERGLAFLFDVSVQNGSPPADWAALKSQPGWAGLSDQEKLTQMLPAIRQPVSYNRKAPIVVGGAEFEEMWGLSYKTPWNPAS